MAFPRCRVSSLLVLVTVMHAAFAASDKVAVQFYGEALCPYCARFLVKTVGPMFSNGLSDIMDFEYIAWGNARVDKDGAVTCQHGPLECKLNRMFLCAMHYEPEARDWFAFVACVESHDGADIESSVSSCAAGHNFTASQLNDCAAGDVGEKLAQAAREATDALNPPHQYVPWVVVNGVPLFDNFDALPSIVCAAYTGRRPEVCFHSGSGMDDGVAYADVNVCRRGAAEQ